MFYPITNIFITECLVHMTHENSSLTRTLRPKTPVKYPPSPPILAPMAAASPTINGFQMAAVAE